MHNLGEKQMDIKRRTLLLTLSAFVLVLSMGFLFTQNKNNEVVDHVTIAILGKG